MTRWWSIGFVSLLAFSCGQQRPSTEENTSVRSVEVPAFNSDSAYLFIERQVQFGPRVPNSPAHEEAANYLITKLNGYGASVTVQEFKATTFDGSEINLKNIIAAFSPEFQKRVLLAAHWDTRPFADKDEVNENASFDGVNDGASGVGILLEVARQMESKSPDVGIDIIFFDGEDWGERYGESSPPLPENLDSWWCLGSQYWSTHKHKPNYSAYYGILLDMVGARRSQFYSEGVSLEYAPKIVEKVWNVAGQLGYSDYFVKQNQASITDDHLYVNKLAKIPMIDIVHYQPGFGYFGDYHHTTKDNIDLISKETLGAVGNTLLHVVYYEESNL